MALVPTDLEVHLQMNSSRFETSDAMRVEVLAFIESRTGSRMTETKVHKHVDSVVKGKGKNKFSGACYNCGKVSHKATECWSRDGASNKGSGMNPSANVTSSGKGKSVGQGTEGVKGHPKGHGKSRSKGKGKGISRGRKGFHSGRPADSLELWEEPWDETNKTEPEEWWNSWADGAEPNRDGAPLGAFVVGGTSWS